MKHNTTHVLDSKEVKRNRLFHDLSFYESRMASADAETKDRLHKHIADALAHLIEKGELQAAQCMLAAIRSTLTRSDKR